jgi:hypothetical protein
VPFEEETGSDQADRGMKKRSREENLERRVVTRGEKQDKRQG